MLITVTLKKEPSGRWTFTGVADPLEAPEKPATVKIGFDNGLVLFEGQVLDALRQVAKLLALLR